VRRSPQLTDHTSTNARLRPQIRPIVSYHGLQCSVCHSGSGNLWSLPIYLAS